MSKDDSSTQDQAQNNDAQNTNDKDTKQEPKKTLQQAQWEDDFTPEQLTVPYSRDEEEQTDESKNDDDEKDDSKGGDENTSTPDEEVDEYTEPEPILVAEDPGEYEPKDYSFTVKDKDGKEVKITTPEEADKFADDDDNFKTAKDLKDFLRKSQKMESSLERDKEDYDSKKTAYEAQNEAETQRAENIENIANEMEYLVGEGLIPSVDDKYRDADWNDPEVAKQPGVKEQIELLNYMAEQNEKRAKAKIRPFNSLVDAYNQRQLDIERKQQADDKKARGEARKAAGARVAGTSATTNESSAPTGIAVGNPNVLKRGSVDWT